MQIKYKLIKNCRYLPKNEAVDVFLIILTAIIKINNGFAWLIIIGYLPGYAFKFIHRRTGSKEKLQRRLSSFQNPSYSPPLSCSNQHNLKLHDPSIFKGIVPFKMFIIPKRIILPDLHAWTQ